jgi:hypothetical protein
MNEIWMFIIRIIYIWLFFVFCWVTYYVIFINPCGYNNEKTCWSLFKCKPSYKLVDMPSCEKQAPSCVKDWCAIWRSCIRQKAVFISCEIDKSTNKDEKIACLDGWWVWESEAVWSESNPIWELKQLCACGEKYISWYGKVSFYYHKWLWCIWRKPNLPLVKKNGYKVSESECKLISTKDNQRRHNWNNHLKPKWCF